MSRLRKTVIPFSWNAITLSFTQGTAGSVDLSTRLVNPRNLTITYSVVGSLPTGVTLAGAIVSYDGAAAAAQAVVQFRATSGNFVAESVSTSVTITATPVVNTDPVWVTAADLGTISAGQAFNFNLLATDAESSPITFVHSPPTFGAAVPQTQSGANRTLVWSGNAPTTAGTYTFTVDVLDATPLGQVTGLAAIGGTLSIALNWTGVLNATSYEVQRSATGTSNWTTITTQAGVTYTDTPLAAGTTYFYRVRALSATQQGEYSAAAAATALAVSTAEQDWIARSTGSGVVWAHDFRTQAEVDNFINDDIALTTTTYSSDGITGGSVMQTIPGNLPAMITAIVETTGTAAKTAEVTCSASLDLTAGVDAVRFFNLSSPWSVMNNREEGGVVLAYPVVAIVSTSPYKFRISTIPTDPAYFSAYNFDPAGFASYSGAVSTVTAQRCRVSRGSWVRPMSALASGNGQSAADRGVTALGMPGRVWNTTSSTARTFAWRRDYYSHADYRTQYGTNYPGIENWFDASGAQLTDNWRGSDFWVQWRVKISASRWQASDAATRNSNALKYFAAWTTWQTPAHEVVWMDSNTDPAPYNFFSASVGGRVTGYTNPSVSVGFDHGAILQPNGDYDTTCRIDGGGNYPAAASCFRMPPDEWVTFLLHVIPGKNYTNNTGWPTASDSTTGTGIQLWACPQSRIDAGNPTYLLIFNKIGVNSYPFSFDNWGTGYAASPNLNEPPPGWNSILFWTYQNNIPQAYGFTRKISQVIFKKGNGGSNVTDGIPCPQV
jgi:hypothetical protein